MPGALKCLAVCLNKYWNSSRCYATSEWVAKMVILWYAGWKATAQKDRENLSYSQVASTSESKPDPKSCRALVLLVSNELGKHIWWYVVYTGLWLFTKVLVGDALLSVSPDIKMWYWDHWGRLSAFPSPSPDMLSGWLLQWFIQSNSTCGMEPFSLLTVSLAPTCKWSQGWEGTEPSPHQRMLTENACFTWSCSKQSQQFTTSLNMLLFIYQGDPWDGWNFSGKMKEAQYLINWSVWSSHCEWCF